MHKLSLPGCTLVTPASVGKIPSENHYRQISCWVMPLIVFVQGGNVSSDHLFQKRRVKF